MKSPYEVEADKYITNDKVKDVDLWKSPPQPSFPAEFIEILDLDTALEEAKELGDKQRNKIEKKKQEERRKEEAKIELDNK